MLPVYPPTPKMLEIITVGNSILRETAKPITVFDGELDTLIDAMTATMYEHDGIGLAAPQVGISQSLCVIDVTPGITPSDTCKINGKLLAISDISPIALINPKIVKFSEVTESRDEGCLSVPGKRGAVTRPSEITVEFVNSKNEPQVMECHGLLSRCAQHEIDHLNGILFIDKVTK